MILLPPKQPRSFLRTSLRAQRAPVDEPEAPWTCRKLHHRAELASAVAAGTNQHHRVSWSNQSNSSDQPDQILASCQTMSQNHNRPKSQLCIENILLYLYQTFQVYNQSVVIVKTISSQSLHDVLSTLIILCFFFFFFNCLNFFFLKIYGIKCTGSVSSSFRELRCCPHPLLSFCLFFL